MLIKNMSVMILAAGYGLRLKPITEKIPKPLVKISDKTLLENTLDYILNMNFKEIVINTHYKHQMIYEFIKNNYKNENIYISYENKLLDTGGGVKNALKLFKNKYALILNSDIYWKKDNFDDINNLIKNFRSRDKCKLLIVDKELAHGINKQIGDFNIYKGIVKRFGKNKKKIYYAGAQVISLKILANYQQHKFSFNLVWDNLISEKKLYAEKMKSHWYHIGDIKGLKEAQN